tara:strand:+ start:873 stop:1100 length:228 start_codon:yes stop_codon:yes gene_type:complete
MTGKNTAVHKYLELMELRNPVQKPIYWWTKMDEKEFIDTLQACLWDSGIDHQSLKWMKLLKGEYVPDKYQTMEND